MAALALKTNMKHVETIANAGNTEVPCYLSIEKLGYSFSRVHEGTDNELWVAENGKLKFVASNQLELLGLIYMREIRGENWKAEDSEIENYLQTYYTK